MQSRDVAYVLQTIGQIIVNCNHKAAPQKFLIFNSTADLLRFAQFRDQLNYHVVCLCDSNL